MSSASAGSGGGTSVEGPPDLGQLAGVGLPAAHQVDGPVLGRGHEPGTRVVRHARLGHASSADHQCVLGQLLGDAHVPDDAGDTRR